MVILAPLAHSFPSFLAVMQSAPLTCPASTNRPVAGVTTKAGGPNNPVDKGKYKLITSGKCADYGADDIASLSECTAAIGAVYGTVGKYGKDGKVTDHDSDTDFFPKGCAAYYRGYPPPGTTLGWTTTTTPQGVWWSGFFRKGTGPCDWMRQCICRNKGKVT